MLIVNDDPKNSNQQQYWKMSESYIYRVSHNFLNISATKYRIFKSFFFHKNWDQYANFEYEYKTISVQYQGAEIFTKQNTVLKQIILYSYCLIVASKLQILCQAPPTGLRQALIATEWLLVGVATQTDLIE